MGSGIAQIAAQSGCEVWITDTRQEALDKSQRSLTATLTTLCEKGKITEEESCRVLGVPTGGDVIGGAAADRIIGNSERRTFAQR